MLLHDCDPSFGAPSFRLIIDDDVDAIGGAPTAGSVIQNVFIHHTKCGVWINGPGTGLLVTDMIVRDTMADGMNLHGGWESVTIERSSFRNQGDDSIALWSDTHADAGNTIRDNLIQLPILANGIAIYGVAEHSIEISMRSWQMKKMMGQSV